MTLNPHSWSIPFAIPWILSARHGGLWLASDAETEQHIADTV